MTPRAVLMKTGLKPLNTSRPVNTAHPKTTVYKARPMSCFSKIAQSTVKRPYQSRTSLTNKNFNQKVNTAKEKVYTAKPKAVNNVKPKAVNTARPTSAVVNAVRANQVHPQKEDQGYVDSGCSRHMTGNMFYLTDFKEFDGRYVTFGGGARGGRITEEEAYVCQPPGFEDPNYPDKVYKVVKAVYGLHHAPRAWYGTLAKSMLMALSLALQTRSYQREDGIFINQDKYVTEILRKFGFTDVKTASTPMDTEKPLLKDSDGDDVDVHLYRSMIGSLMYLTSSRPDIMFAVCVCARFQVTPKVSHSHAVKRIFRYLKGQPKLVLWYPINSPFDLVSYSNSNYAGASLDRKSTTGGCQFLGCRLISWQCKKQTVVATSSTKAEYVAAASCCGQVLWIQNQMLDYGYNFMHTMINIDNNSTICIVKNPVSHTKTKHIEIRYHFIRDCYDKKLIQVVKIYTDHNFADLLTKALDVGRFQYLVASIGMLNP
ncbi:putative ribonuclease H-like domain-containing protein [Tanacetum coccineum]|uniref:Ribonuclease H-like domain-containing protein n=1 Tax=Tanacetum coccineum TaxID=301880 RepID=A0ABQ5B2S7_9ASTR